MQSSEQIRQEIARLRRILKARKRETLGLPSKKPATHWKDGHEYLVGVQAHFWRRLEIYRNAGGDIALVDGTFENIEDLRPGMCQGCAETHPVGWYEGEWHHASKKQGGRRCDCAAHSLWVCHTWHVLQGHGRVLHWSQR